MVDVVLDRRQVHRQLQRRTRSRSSPAVASTPVNGSMVKVKILPAVVSAAYRYGGYSAIPLFAVPAATGEPIADSMPLLSRLKAEIVWSPPFITNRWLAPSTASATERCPR